MLVPYALESSRNRLGVDHLYPRQTSDELFCIRCLAKVEECQLSASEGGCCRALSATIGAPRRPIDGGSTARPFGVSKVYACYSRLSDQSRHHSVVGCLGETDDILPDVGRQARMREGAPCIGWHRYWRQRIHTHLGHPGPCLPRRRPGCPGPIHRLERTSTGWIGVCRVAHTRMVLHVVSRNGSRRRAPG